MSYSLKSLYASLPKTERGKPIVIGTDPKGKNILYVNGNSVLIRNVENPAIADIYTEHANPTTVAKYSPSGFYIASGDSTGKVRIWDTTNKEHILKSEFTPISGAIRDLAWSPDSQKIVAVGEGREKFGHVFSYDSGNSVGEIMGQSKSLNSVDYRSARPFRIATASEDNTVAFFAGPPFKFQSTSNEHTRFVNAVRYAPDGSIFVSGGADGRAIVFNGENGEKVGEFGSPAHKGGIYALAFSGNGQHVVTVSGDKTAKIWEVSSKQLTQEFVMGNAVEDMLVGCAWQGETIIVVSVAGHISYLDRQQPGKPWKVIKGHNKPITGLAVVGHTIFTGSSDGVICHWDASNGSNDTLAGKGHTNQVQDLAVTDNLLVSVSMDDTLILTPLASKQYSGAIKLPSQPRGVAASGNLVIVACVNEVVVLRDGKIVSTLKVNYEPSCVAIGTSGHDVVVGSGKDNAAHVYRLDVNNLTETSTLTLSGTATDVKYSPDGRYLAAGDTNRKVALFAFPGYQPLITTEWSNHTARVNSISWSPDSRFLATGSLDTNVIIWSPDTKNKVFEIKGGHPMSPVNRVQWLDNSTLITVGRDCCVRTWNINA